MGPDGALSSDEVNFLIYRYLLEAGFTHAAFVFGCESTVTKVNIDGNDVPIGALVSFIQKGFQFMELEANLNEEGTDVYGKYIGLTARDILTKDLKELRDAARELKLESADDAAPPVAGPSKPAAEANGHHTPQAAVDMPLSSLDALPGHAGAEVNSLSWSSAAGVLATACGDGIARLWNPTSGNCLKCQPAVPPADSSEVLVAVEWAPDGSTLAAATDSGRILLWSTEGAHRHAMDAHRAGVLALQWGKNGKLIASGSADGSVALWDPLSGEKRAEWTLPGGAAVFDLDWRDERVLAVAGQDGTIAVYNADESEPLSVSKDHGGGSDDVIAMDVGGIGGPGASGQVNQVRWDPSGAVLASASNDMSVGLIRFKESGGDVPASMLKGHKREVTAVAWGRGDAPLLASGSADGSVRLWDTAQKKCVGVLDRHEDGIGCLVWSPDGSLLATGDGEGNVTVWGVGKISGSGGTILCTLRGSGQVADLQWVDGSSLAVSFFGASGPSGVGLLSVKGLGAA